MTSRTLIPLVTLFVAAFTAMTVQASPSLSPADEQGRYTYLVTFSEQGLLDLHRERSGTVGNFDFHSPAIQTAREEMAADQRQMLTGLSAELGRSVEATHHYLVTHSGVAIRLSKHEAGRVRTMRGVADIRQERLYELSTYRGPSFIGADALWDGSSAPGGAVINGEGTVIAVLDTGIPDAAHASFDNDPACGHGQGGAPDKVLSSLDCSSTDGSGLCNGGSPGDTNGHGSHTASTAGGNLIDASASPSPALPGSFTEMSGVAHCANIRSYKVCASNQCGGADIQAGMQSVLIHGDVDAMNFSISGGLNPWSDNDRTKLDLVDSGVFVAASAGNTSFTITDPVGNVNHLGPWVLSVAASTRDTNTSGGSAQGDVLANFSLRGPTPEPFDGIQKPNITAPGVDIYAAVPGGYDFISGTSMSGPHAAGAGALVAQAHPGWTPMEIKSALQMTSFNGGFEEDGTTPWNADQVGSGRVDLTRAALAGLVMDETTANFLAADPNAGGDPKTLNVPSMRNTDCTPSCSFTRTVRNTLSSASNWSVSAGSDVAGDFDVQVSPSSFSFTGDPSETQELTVTVLPTGDLTGSIAFGEVTLSEDGAQAPDSRLTVAISGVGGPSIDVTPASLDFTLNAGDSDSATVTIESTGTQDLNWTIAEANPDAADSAGRGTIVVEEDLAIPNFSVTPGSPAEFDVAGGVANIGSVTGFRFEGTTTAVNGGSFSSDTKMVMTAPGGPSFDVGGFDNVVNDWAFQGGGSADPGTYASEHNGVFGAGGTPDAGDWNFVFSHDWSSGENIDWENVTVTLLKEQQVCEDITDVSWLSLDTTSGTTAPGASDNVQVSVDASGLSAGVHQAQLCIDSDAINSSLVRVPVTLEVTDPPDPDETSLVGTVSTTGYCGSNPQDLSGASVEVVGQTQTFNTTTTSLGDYSINVPDTEGPVDINVSASGNLPDGVVDIALGGGATVTNDFNLVLDAPCASAGTASFAVTLPQGDTSTESLDVNNDGAASMTYSIEIDEAACDTPAGLPWVSATPTSGSVGATSSAAVTLTFDSSGQPVGNHSGNLCLTSSDSENPLIQIPLSLEVTQPAGTGTVEGTVTTQGYCGSNPGVLEGVEVVVESASDTYTLTTNASGFYQLFVPASESPVDVTVSHPDHLGDGVVGIEVAEGATDVADFDLALDAPCAEVAPGALASSQASDETVALDLTIDNVNGAADLNWTIDTAESPSDGVQGGDIVEFNDIDFTPNQDFTGGSVQWNTGGTCDCDDAPFDFNMWGATNLSFFWPRSAGPEGGVSLDGSTYAVLQPGDTVGSGSQFIALSADTATVNWRQAGGVDGYLGFQFVNPDTSETNYGYAHIVTSGEQGHPVTVTGWAYNEAGDPITIPEPIGDACTTPASIPWLSVDPTSGTTAAGATSSATVTLDSTGLAGGSYTGVVCVNSDDSQNDSIGVTVQMDVLVDEVFADRFEDAGAPAQGAEAKHAP